MTHAFLVEALSVRLNDAARACLLDAETVEQWYCSIDSNGRLEVQSHSTVTGYPIVLTFEALNQAELDQTAARLEDAYATGDEVTVDRITDNYPDAIWGKLVNVWGV